MGRPFPTCRGFHPKLTLFPLPRGQQRPAEAHLWVPCTSWGLAGRKAAVNPHRTRAGDLVFGWKASGRFVDEVALETDLEEEEVSGFDPGGGCWEPGSSS